MVKIAGLTYVDEFTFPTEQGFTGSAGKENVRGYYRGGRVKKDPVKAAAQKPRAPGPGASHGGEVKAPGARRKASGAGMPKNVKARGGKMEYAGGGTVGVTTPRRGKSMPQQAEQEHYAAKSAAKGHGGKMEYAEGGYAHMGGPHPEEEYPKSKAGKKMPPGVKARGGMMEYNEGGSVHDKLRAEGEKMGYRYGGQVKNTSAEFVQTSGKQATMDNANYPPGHPSSARDQESGPRKKLRPKFKKGGGVHHVRDVSMSRRKASKKGMPKGVKNRGGLMEYAAGGYAVGGVKKGEQAVSGIRLTLGRIQEQITETEDILQEAAGASKRTITGGRATAAPRSATPPRSSLASYVRSQAKAESPSTATQEAKAKSRSEPSIEQTGVGEFNEATFGSPMKPVMHVKRAGGGVVSAAKGGRKKSRKMR